MSKKDKYSGAGIFGAIILLITGLFLSGAGKIKQNHIADTVGIIIFIVIIALGLIGGFIGMLMGDPFATKMFLVQVVCFSFVYFLAKSMI